MGNSSSQKPNTSMKATAQTKVGVVTAITDRRRNP